MKSILENPYRITGLLVGVGAREQERQIRRLKQYIEAEQEPEEDFSFPSLGILHRSIEKVENAAAKLTLDNDKINAALFWFYNGNAITDEPAFDALKEAKHEDCINIWSKLIANGVVTQRNSSAFHNLSTIYLCNAINGSVVKAELLEKAVELKIKFLESEFIKDFKSNSTDQTFKINKKELQLLFLNQLNSEIENNGSLNSKAFVEIIDKQEFIAKEDFLKGFVQKPIEQTEKKIEEAKKKRKSSPSTADKTGKTLYDETASELAMLKNILGSNNIKYSSIADKVAEEILQCGIDYFKKYKESDTINPGKPSMNLLLKAKELSVGNILKQRCHENIDDLQEWIDEKPERDKQKKIEKDFKDIIEILQKFENKSNTVESARLLITYCKPILNNIKIVLGGTDNLYLKLSTKVANIVQHNVIGGVNECLKILDNRFAIESNGTINYLKITLTEAWAVTLLLGSLDMENEFKIKHYNPNKESLKGLCGQLGVSTTTNSSSSLSNSGSIYTPKPTPTPTLSSTPIQKPTPTSPRQTQQESEFNFFANAWWILGLIGLVIGAAAAGGAGAAGGGILGVALGGRLSKW
jgi:hypothetical protein